MPTYDYQCGKCDYEFEREQRITEDPIKTCPKCKSRKAKRLLSASNFILKGGGWYADGYASGGGKKSEDSADSAEKSSAKSDSDSKDKSEKKSTKKAPSEKASSGNSTDSKKPGKNKASKSAAG